jgi:hypothetical protein
VSYIASAHCIKHVSDNKQQSDTATIVLFCVLIVWIAVQVEVIRCSGLKSQIRYTVMQFNLENWQRLVFVTFS